MTLRNLKLEIKAQKNRVSVAALLRGHGSREHLSECSILNHLFAQLAKFRQSNP
jgi:hypothetical protein